MISFSRLCNIRNVLPCRTMYVNAFPSRKNIKLEEVDKYTHFISHESTEFSKRPMVILFSWLTAKEKHLTGFYDYYLRNNFDIVKVQVHPFMILRPLTLTPVLERMLCFISNKEHNEKPLMVHGFSIGAYMLGITMKLILQDRDQYGKCGQRILGIVADSPVDYDNAIRGISESITASKVLQNVIQASVQSYFDMFPNTVKRYMLDSRDMCTENPFRIPTLYIFSCKDGISPRESTLKVIAHQKKYNVPSFAHEFDTPHVQHYRHYPDQYTKLLDDFVNFIGIKNKSKL